MNVEFDRPNADQSGGTMAGNFGKLGESAESHEAARVADLHPLPPNSQALAAYETSKVLGDATLAAEIAARQAVTYVMRTELGAVREAINGMVADLRSNSELVRTIDIPLEHVASAHERASASFENLRHDISDISSRLGAVEQVIDVAGLRKAQGGAEARFIKLCALLEQTVKGLQAIEGGALEAARERIINVERPKKPKPTRKRQPKKPKTARSKLVKKPKPVSEYW